jgi:uncharacterized membrane protein YfcA
MIWTVLGLIILLAYTLEAITGFGSIIIALSLGVIFFPLDQILPILVPLNICMTGFLSYKNRLFINKELLLLTILPGMLLGTAVGYFAKPYLDESILKQLFGALILWFAVRELWFFFKKKILIAKPLWLTRLITLFAGVTHGLFASGGPLLVYALAGTALDKARFRATMVFVWFILNSILTIAFFIDGRLVPVLPKVVYYIPILFLAVIIGNILHDKIKEEYFRLVIYILLSLTALILILGPYIH